MALAGLLPPKPGATHEETKSGVFVYSGQPSLFHEFSFRAKAKYYGTKTDDRILVGPRLLEGLRGEAFLIARDFGVENLAAADGVLHFLTFMEDRLFPFRETEAKELYYQGSKVGGPLARAPGESMQSYITRRRRWYDTLTSLDPKTDISENIRADLLLSLSGLDKTERLMVMTSVNNKFQFDLIAEALVRQHPKLHLRERVVKPMYSSGKNGKGKGKQQSKSKKGDGKSGAKHFSSASSSTNHTAFLADEPLMEDDLYEEEGWEDYQEEDEGAGLEAYVCNEEYVTHDGPDPSLEDETKENLEFDVMLAYIATSDFDVTDMRSVEELADVAQSEVLAYFARGKAKGKGVQMGTRPLHRRPSNLTLEDRRKKLKEIKSRSVCKSCGVKGHWAGDPECRMAPKKVAHVATLGRILDRHDQSSDSESVPHGPCCGCGKVSERECANARCDHFRCSECGPCRCCLPTSTTTTANTCLHLCDNSACQNRCVRPHGHGSSRDPAHFCHSCEASVPTSVRTRTHTVCIPCEEPESGEKAFPAKAISVEDAAIPVDDEDMEEDTFPEGWNSTFSHGLYEGCTYLFVLEKHPEYVAWAQGQKGPSPQLQSFLTWVHRNYESDGVDTFFARESAVKDVWNPPTNRTSKLSRIPQTQECKEGCKQENITHQGSSVRFIQSTCIKCGKRTKLPRPQVSAAYSSETCPHTSTDNRGSNRSVHKVYCKLCQTVLSEEPQSIYKKRVGLSDKALKGSLQEARAIERAVTKEKLTGEQALNAIKLFAKQASMHAGSSKEVSVSELVAMLHDAVDVQLGGQDSKSLPSAFMALVDTDMDTEQTLPEPAPDGLKEIDCLCDDGVWIALDEGCNANAHGQKWGDNAQAKFRKLGFQCPMLSSSRKAYGGIGSATSVGKRRFPLSLRLRNNMCIAGAIDSNELEGVECPLLLSQSAQAKLGLIKNMRTSTCLLSDYEQEVQLARCSKSGLLLICITDFLQKPEDMPNVLKELRTKEAKESDWHEDDSSSNTVSGSDGTACNAGDLVDRDVMSSVYEKVAYATRATIHPTRKTVRIVVGGVEQIERCGGDRSTLLRLRIGGSNSNRLRLKGDVLSDLAISISTNFPELQPAISTDSWVCIDARAFRDPGEKDPSGSGYHSSIQRGLLKDPNFDAVWEEVHVQVDALLASPSECTEPLVLVLCKSGRHRSVAIGEFLRHCLERQGMTVMSTVTGEVNDGRSWVRCGGPGRCQDCVKIVDKEIGAHVWSAWLQHKMPHKPCLVDFLQATQNKPKPPSRPSSTARPTSNTTRPSSNTSRARSPEPRTAVADLTARSRSPQRTKLNRPEGGVPPWRASAARLPAEQEPEQQPHQNQQQQHQPQHTPLESFLEVFDPTAIGARDLTSLFIKDDGSHKTRNFTGYLPLDSPHGQEHLKCRFYGKCKATHTGVSFASHMEQYLKYVWVQHTERSPWVLFEEAYGLGWQTDFTDDERPYRLVVLAVPPKREGLCAYYARTPNLATERTGIMTKTEHRKFRDQTSALVDHDLAVFGGKQLLRLVMIGVLLPLCIPTEHAIEALNPYAAPQWPTRVKSAIAEGCSAILVHACHHDPSERHHAKLKEVVEASMEKGIPFLIIDECNTPRWKELQFQDSLVDAITNEPVCFADGRGDVRFASCDKALLDRMCQWAYADEVYGYPRSYADSAEDSFFHAFVDGITQAVSTRQAWAAFPAEMRMEQGEGEPLDSIVDEEDDANPIITEQAEQEAEVLENLPMPGHPQEESERRRKWLSLPRTVRAAIRRLHRMLGYKPSAVLVRILKGARASEEWIQAAKLYQNDAVHETSEVNRTHPVAAPLPYVFNDTVAVDCFELKDDSGARYTFFSVICMGTLYHQVEIVASGGQPSSKACLTAFQNIWCRWAGWPRRLICDRGLHNRGIFMKTLSARGVRVSQIGLESAEHLGRAERHGGLIKSNMKRVIKEAQLVGEERMRVCATECILAKNSMIKHGGFTSAQWVLGREPRDPGRLLDDEELGDMGVIQDQLDPDSMFALASRCRFEARKAFVHEDCGRKARTALLRNAGPVPMQYRVGDVVCYRKEQGSKEAGTEWSTASRIIGFEGKTVWVLCEGVPVATSLGRIRTCSTAELLAYNILHRQGFVSEPAGMGDDQQGFIDARAAPHSEETQQNTPQTASPALPIPGTPRPRTIASTPVPTSRSQRQTRHARSRTPPRLAEIPEDSPMTDGLSFTPDPTREESRVDSAASTEGLPSMASSSSLASAASSQHTALMSFRAERLAFMADRMEGFGNALPSALRNRASKAAAKRRREAKGRTLNLRTAEPEVQNSIRNARKVEWDKWQRFNATHSISGLELQALLDEGHKPLGMHWLDTDKNEPLRTATNPVPPKYKSRLVVRGDQESQLGDVRSDSPTSDVESHNLIFSFAASRNLKVKSADITNAYFQGEPVDRVLLFRQPEGGLEGLEQGEMLLARVPINGTQDAGRGFWKRLRKVICESGLKENRVKRALYTYSENGVVQAMLATHVDDILWAAQPSAEGMIQNILNTFEFGKVEEGSFRFCGKQITQAEDYTITVTCKETTEKIRAIGIEKGRKLTDALNEGELTQLRGVAGSLAWIVRQCRPDLAYRTSKIQTSVSGATVADLREANKVVQYAQQTSDTGLTFRSGVLDWDDMVSGVITDASHANESSLNQVTKQLEPYRSQGARLQILATPSLLEGTQAGFHLISYSSSTLKRVCRATVQAEAYALQAGVEAGDHLRAAIADIKGELTADWEASAASTMRQVWLTDCKSVEQALTRPVMAKMADKRLAIEVASLRQNLWRIPGDPKGDPYLEDERPSNATDLVFWIDTDVMIADPLTKAMDPSKLLEALRTNHLDLNQPHESVQKKRAKQLARRKNKDDDEIMNRDLQS
eukprot:6492618-Amphidinium_carterae.1